MAECYLAPNTPGWKNNTIQYNPNWNSGPNLTPVEKTFTSAIPGFVHCLLANNDCVTVETGKNYLIGKYWVEN